MNIYKKDLEMEMKEPEYNFKLDSYSDHIKAVLKEMITDPVFSDVTLVFDDLQIKSTFYKLIHQSPLFYISMG